MATYLTYINGRSIAGRSGSFNAGAPAQVVIEGMYDASLRNTIAADIVPIINLPARCIVKSVAYEIVTPEAVAAQTFSLGRTAAPTGWVVGAAGNASAVAGTTALGAGALNTISGDLQTAASTIDLTVDALMALTTLKVRVFAVVALLG